MSTHIDKRCLNCGHYAPKSAAFCPACSQKLSVHRLSFHAIAHDMLHYFTHVERNIFSLIKALTVRPGIVCKEYLEGKRKRYFPPVNFFLIAAGLLALSASLFNTFQIAFATGSSATIRDTNSPLLHILSSRINWLLLLTTPIIALLYRLFFFKRGHNFVEHLAMSFYCMGYLLLLFAVIAIPLFSFINTLYGFEVLLWLFVLAAVFYYTLTYHQLYSKRSLVSFLTTLLISVAVFSALFLFILLALRLYYTIAN